MANTRHSPTGYNAPRGAEGGRCRRSALLSREHKVSPTYPRLGRRLTLHRPEHRAATAGIYATMRTCSNGHCIELLRDKMHTYDVGRPEDGRFSGLPGLAVSQDVTEDCSKYLSY